MGVNYVFIAGAIIFGLSGKAVSAQTSSEIAQEQFQENNCRVVLEQLRNGDDQVHPLMMSYLNGLGGQAKTVSSIERQFILRNRKNLSSNAETYCIYLSKYFADKAPEILSSTDKVEAVKKPTVNSTVASDAGALEMPQLSSKDYLFGMLAILWLVWLYRLLTS